MKFIVVVFFLILIVWDGRLKHNRTEIPPALLYDDGWIRFRKGQNPFSKNRKQTEDLSVSYAPHGMKADRIPEKRRLKPEKPEIPEYPAAFQEAVQKSMKR